MAIQATWYFALIDEDEAFDPDVHNRQDTEILGFTLEHEEGSFATLRLITRNPLGEDTNGTFALGLLGPGRKIWCLFSRDAGAGAELLFRGRLVGLPTDVFGAKVTLDFQARPQDYVDQRATLAESLRVLPWYDPCFYDEQQRADDDLVLEARSARWYVNPSTLDLSISDILLGEGGTELFLQSEHRSDGLQLNYGSPPPASVSVDVEFNWTQRAAGTVTFGITSSSYTLNADSYPKAGASFGDGWTVAAASVSEPFSFETKSIQSGSELTINWWDGEKSSLKTSESHDRVLGPGVELPAILTNYTTKSAYSEGILTSWNVDESWSTGLIPLHDVTASYSVAYDAARPMTEHVTYQLVADMQPIVTLPEDAEPRRMDFKSLDLSEPLDAAIIIDDPRRRTYIGQARGRQSLFYTLLSARAALRSNARAVELTFAPFLNRLADLRLDKSATVHDWRIPGGSATGKIIKFTATLVPPTESQGASFSLNVTIGCAIGNGGTLSNVAGDPDYVADDYIDQSEDYQEYIGQVLTFNDDVGFTVPLFDPNDDGLDFISGLTESNIFEVPVSLVGDTASEQAEAVAAVIAAPSGVIGITDQPPPSGYETWADAAQAAVQARTDAITNALVPTKLQFKLRDMRGKFTTEVPLVVGDLKIPTMIDLGAS